MKGHEELGRADALARELQALGVMTPIADIEGHELPQPYRWQANVDQDKAVCLKAMDFFQRQNFVREHRLQNATIGPDEIVTVRMVQKYVWDGSPFIEIMTNQGEQVFIRWDFVTEFRIAG